MYKREKITREDRYRPERKNPSFSSTLLDEIYRSTDDGTAKSPDLKFYREAIQKKQSKNIVRSNRTVEEEQTSSLRGACLIDKWMDKKVSEKAKQFLTAYERKSYRSDHYHDHDQDTLFFSSTSSSSDSSSGGFSSSDTDSLYGSRSRSSCLVPPRPKPVRTSMSAQAEKPKKTERNLFYEQREAHMFDDYHYNSGSAAELTPKLEDSLIKSKSRALKIYSNLKKVKQPISPGGRLASFINSLFTTVGNTKKPKNSPSSLNSSYDDVNADSYAKSGQASACSSTSSFSRSCLSKHSPSTKERLRNGVKRSVRFYPVSVIVDEDCRPCGHKSLYQEEDASLMSVSVPTVWKMGKSPSRKEEKELKFQVKQRSERVNELERELYLKDYHQNQKDDDEEEEEEEEDDAASCSSSDLFELDHLSMIGKNRYCEELPVYETTHVHRNRAIANGFIM